MKSPIDIIYQNKRNSIISKLEEPKSLFLTEVADYVRDYMKYTFPMIVEHYTNPDDAYPIFDTPNLIGKSFGWSCQYDNDPRFDMTIKLISHDNYAFDFNFFGKTYDKSDKEDRPKGDEYMATVHYVVKEKVIPWFKSTPVGTTLTFVAHEGDGLQAGRKRFFEYLIKQHGQDPTIQVDIDGYDFNLTKIK